MGSSRTFVFLAGIAMLFCCVAGSAIPMWEFLSRDEKVSHLFRVFSQQVARYCADSPRPDCNKNLLVSGVKNLASMDENRLDKLDPYQRGATEMIWRAMVGTDRFSSRASNEADEAYFTTGADPLATGGSETNGLGEETASANDYVRPSSEHTGPYLVGPMVIRVYPDGRPVPEDSTRPLPRDEDAEELRHARVPSIEEIEANSNGNGNGNGNSFYGKRTKDEATKRPLFPVNKNRRRQSVLTIEQQPPPHFRGGPDGFEGRLLQEVAKNRRVHYY